MSSTTTTQTPKSSPVAALVATENALAASINAIAARVDQIATLTTADALTRLADSIDQAKNRLASVFATVQRMTGDLNDDVEALTSSLLGDLAANDVIEAPASQPPLGVSASPGASVNGHARDVRVEKSTQADPDEVIDLAAATVNPRIVEGTTATLPTILNGEDISPEHLAVAGGVIMSVVANGPVAVEEVKANADAADGTSGKGKTRTGAKKGRKV